MNNCPNPAPITKLDNKPANNPDIQTLHLNVLHYLKTAKIHALPIPVTPSTPLNC